MMIAQSGRAIASLRTQCLASHRTIVTSSISERTNALNVPFFANNQIKKYPNPKYRLPLRSRSYADKPVSRPKAHTGRTSATQRKAPSTSATRAAKNPAPKKTAPKAVPNEKSTAKPRLKSKPKPRKKAKAKPKPKKRVLTDEQKTRKVAKLKKENIASLKEKALLHSPKNTPYTAWQVLIGEQAKAHVGGTKGGKIGDMSKDAASQYRALTPEQLEHYNHLANQNLAANKAAYAKWVESYTPQQIREANIARRTLARLQGKKGSSKFSRIADDRQVRGPATAYILFYRSRYATGDFKGLKVAEAAKLASREWKALSAAEQKPYLDNAAQDRLRHTQEMKTIYEK